MNPGKSKNYITKILKEANHRRNRLKGYKSQLTQAYKKGLINEPERNFKNKQIDDARVVLNQYSNHYENKIKTFKGLGIKKRGGNVIFTMIPQN